MSSVRLFYWQVNPPRSVSRAAACAARAALDTAKHHNPREGATWTGESKPPFAFLPPGEGNLYKMGLKFLEPDREGLTLKRNPCYA